MTRRILALPGDGIGPDIWSATRHVLDGAVERIYHHGNKSLAGSPVGQIVGRMNEVRSTADVMADLKAECAAVTDRMAGYFTGSD